MCSIITYESRLFLPLCSDFILFFRILYLAYVSLTGSLSAGEDTGLPFCFMNSSLNWCNATFNFLYSAFSVAISSSLLCVFSAGFSSLFISTSALYFSSFSSFGFSSFSSFCLSSFGLSSFGLSSFGLSSFGLSSLCLSFSSFGFSIFPLELRAFCSDVDLKSTRPSVDVLPLLGESFCGESFCGENFVFGDFFHYVFHLLFICTIPC